MSSISRLLKKSVVTLTLICMFTGLLTGLGRTNETLASDEDGKPIWCEVEGNVVTVKWLPMDDADDYRVFRKKTNSSTWTTIATVNNNIYEYIDEEVDDGTYVYSVCKRSYDSTGYKRYGARIQADPIEVNQIEENVVCVEDPFVYAVVDGTTVTVYWTLVDGAADYRVFRRKVNSNSWTTIATVNNRISEYEENNVASGEYVYAVCKRTYDSTGYKRYGNRIESDILIVEATPAVRSASRAVYAVAPTATPTATDTPVPTATNTPKPTATNTPKPTATNTPVPTATNTPKPTATNTPVPTATNTPKPTATNTPKPTATNTPKPTATSTPKATATSPAEFKATSLREALIYTFAHGGEFVDVSHLNVTSNDVSKMWTELIYNEGTVLTEWAAYKTPLYSVKKSGTKVTAVGINSLDNKFYERYSQIQAAIAKAMSCISPEMSDFEKAIALQNYIVDTTTYTTSIDNSGAAYNVLINGKGKCVAYADAYRVLLNAAGIETRNVGSYTHTWTAAKLDGVWYLFDPTWDDDTKAGAYGYTYFARTAKEYESGLTKKHGSFTFSGETVECTDSRYANWFGHSIVGRMYYCNGAWYYADGNNLIMTDVYGNNQSVVLTENGTITMVGSTDSTVTYKVSGKTITINR